MNIAIPRRTRIISISEPSGKDGSFSRRRQKLKRNVYGRSQPSPATGARR
jgi:hypothetical protein